MDQDWNPLYDEQSIGRLYRYGQKKPVFVYRLMTAVSIEEKIFFQSVHKRSISRYIYVLHIDCFVLIFKFVDV